MTTEQHKTREIYLAGGCFWGTEHFFKQVVGVVATEVGYANGKTKNPTTQTTQLTSKCVPIKPSLPKLCTLSTTQKK